MYTNTQSQGITASSLDNQLFKKQFGLKLAYVTGAMIRGIASKEMVIAMGKAGRMGYFGAGGLGTDELETAITEIKKASGENPFDVNFLHQPADPAGEEALTDLLLSHDIKNSDFRSRSESH